MGLAAGVIVETLSHFSVSSFTVGKCVFWAANRGTRSKTFQLQAKLPPSAPSLYRVSNWLCRCNINWVQPINSVPFIPGTTLAGPQNVGERANVFAGRFLSDDLEGQFLSGLFEKVPSAHGKWAQKSPIFMVSNISGLFFKEICIF